MNVLRFLLSVIVLAVSAGTIYFLTYLPLLSNHQLFYVEAATARARRTSDAYLRIMRARENLAQTRAIISRTPAVIEAYGLAADNAVILGRYQEAADLLGASLRYQKTSEAIYQLGLVRCGMGETREALELLVSACSFDSARCWQLPADCVVAGDVHAVIQQQQDAMRRRATASTVR